MPRLIEIRTYTIKRGRRETFHALVSQQSVPLLAAANIDVIAFGESVNDPDGYFLIRAFDDATHLQSSQEAFYASDVWRHGPRAAVIDCIANDANAVFWLTEEGTEALRQSHLRTQA